MWVDRIAFFWLFPTHTSIKASGTTQMPQASWVIPDKVL